uniref:Uncharacterized protein n=1 Tax=Mucochytrium quahogii TaxID=96639 RepID=A0A7S2S0N4_9STRA|mmetsp:Transcript_2303/g.3343  ORF Transcript_2303/g.3343 Transcript_2303/m.3343 type:complete len:189 (-) Transcript_2303:1629-2195(-)|eukprot:CAMPEP_0203795644 /NCGR_PEP_ID=MMETSP0100_2-20121128/7363_1 /ASSEMBLY_ACC=CAM_ASM_000210 /TAXON_ID=96639 /ORGANISM=" , Strain NY0313808BC1" /LENGTH=188 /DNA_ID=CAMNT_0050700213 /DNA_START=411 /DNA_END=977 /DNA_ORIENTATION=+
MAAMNFAKTNEMLKSFAQGLRNNFGKLSSGPTHLRLVVDGSGRKRVKVIATSAATQAKLTGNTFTSSNSLYYLLDANVATIIKGDSMGDISIKSDGFVFVNIIGTHKSANLKLKPFKDINPENLLVNAQAFTRNIHIEGTTAGTWLLSNEKSSSRLSTFQLNGGQLFSLGPLEITQSTLRCGLYGPNA